MQFLNSKFFDPDFWFKKETSLFHFLSNYTFTAQAKDIFNTILLLISMFFLSIISYCAIRMFEIRAKEKKHLQHEIEEYAHHHAQKESQNHES